MFDDHSVTTGVGVLVCELLEFRFALILTDMFPITLFALNDCVLPTCLVAHNEAGAVADGTKDGIARFGGMHG